MRRLFPTLLCTAVLLSCAADPNSLRISGTVEIREIRLAPLAAGRIVDLRKDEGDTVRRGDTVAILDQPGLSALVSQKEAQAQAAQTRTADITAALADSTRAANDLARAKGLLAQHIISQQQYDAFAAAATGTAARVASARASAQESHAAAQGVAAMAAIRDQLTLVAPEDGIVLTRFLDRGEAAAAGTPVVSIGVVSHPWVRAYVGEPYIARVRVGQAVRVFVDGYPKQPFSGRIVEIAPRAEFTPRLALTERERADLVFSIKVEIDPAAGRLKAGMPVTLEVPLLP
jgi:multidrug resistance efflux pump